MSKGSPRNARMLLHEELSRPMGEVLDTFG